MKRTATTFVLSTLLAGVSFAQTPATNDVPPPPQPAAQSAGPNLDVTMKYILDKLQVSSKAIYAVYYHDDGKGTDFTVRAVEQLTAITSSEQNCRLDYHEKLTGNDKVITDQDNWFRLRFVQQVMVMPEEQRLKEADAREGNPLARAHVEPAVFNLRVRLSTGRTYDFNLFYDEDTANRLAKAVIHAVELCGGGDNDPFK